MICLSTRQGGYQQQRRGSRCWPTSKKLLVPTGQQSSPPLSPTADLMNVLVAIVKYQAMGELGGVAVDIMLDSLVQYDLLSNICYTCNL